MNENSNSFCFGSRVYTLSLKPTNGDFLLKHKRNKDTVSVKMSTEAMFDGAGL